MAKAGKEDKRPRRRAAGHDEAWLWREVVRDVRPLPGRGRAGPEGQAYGDAADEAGEGPPDEPAPPPRPVSAGASPRFPDLRHGTAPGVDKRTAQRLRRGQLPIEGRIDLHGLTQAEAHRALAAFLAGSREAGRRCVLVITGKGLGADGSVGVLRSAVPRWLNEAANRAHVLAYAYATPRDGGEGALNVLLRRTR